MPFPLMLFFLIVPKCNLCDESNSPPGPYSSRVALVAPQPMRSTLRSRAPDGGGTEGLSRLDLSLLLTKQSAVLHLSTCRHAERQTRTPAQVMPSFEVAAAATDCPHLGVRDGRRDTSPAQPARPRLGWTRTDGARSCAIEWHFSRRKEASVAPDPAPSRVSGSAKHPVGVPAQSEGCFQ